MLIKYAQKSRIKTVLFLNIPSYERVANINAKSRKNTNKCMMTTAPI